MPRLRFFPLAAAAFALIPPPALPAQCGFAKAFDRPDGGKTVPVYEGSPDPALTGSKPLAYVSALKVNTDGTRISYKVDDPMALHGAINPIVNAMHSGFKVADFQRIAANNWEPLSETWRILSAGVIEKDTRLHKTGKPCVDAGGYLVSKTADVAVAGGFGRDGDCDQTKWIDSLTIPALVLPMNSQFQTRGALTRGIVVVMTLGATRRLAYGIVGDAGPEEKIGEASVAMNRILNGLAAGDNPKNAHDAIVRFQAPRSLILIFPGAKNRVNYPITPQRAGDEAKARFNAWGGEARLTSCTAEIPAAH